MCFIAAFLLSEMHAHDHEQTSVGDSCAICACIASAKNLFKQSGALSAFGSLLAFIAALYALPTSANAHTPVSLKIRLNN
jgi:hypothetical protein